MTTNDLKIRSVQHYLYCPHRWGLTEIDCVWSENYFVTKANLLHDRVHDPKSSRFVSDKMCYTSVTVYNDNPQYNLYGITDCIEVKNKKLCIVEYKPTKPKNAEYNYDDLMQVFAQKICVDSVFNCDCDGIIYYADVKKRIKLPLKENFEEYDQQLKTILQEMRTFIKNGVIPKIKKGQKCNGCSMKDVCMPSLKKFKGVRQSIDEIAEKSL